MEFNTKTMSWKSIPVIVKDGYQPSDFLKDDTVLHGPIFIDRRVKIGAHVEIGAGTAIFRDSVIESSVSIGDRCIVRGSIGKMSTLGDECIIASSAKILDNVSLRDRVAVLSLSVVGSESTIEADTVIYPNIIVPRNIDTGIMGTEIRFGISVNGLHWPVFITDSFMQIGCTCKTHEEWLQMSDKEIFELDGHVFEIIRFKKTFKKLMKLARETGKKVPKITHSDDQTPFMNQEEAWIAERLSSLI